MSQFMCLVRARFPNQRHEGRDKFRTLLNICDGDFFAIIVCAPQTHDVYSTLKRRGNDRFHIVSTRNTRGMFVARKGSIKDV